MIEKRRRRDRDGKAYQVFRVRWRDDEGRERSRTLPRGTRREEAEEFERRVMTLKRVGDLGELDRGRLTLADFAEHWWEAYAQPNLAASTLARYAEVWNTHALDRLGELRLREVKPPVLARFRSDLERRKVGAATIRKTFVVLQSMLARAVEEGHLADNPARLVSKPPQRRKRGVVVVAPLQVERLRANIIERDREGRGLRDQALVSTLAYAGPRPWSEAAPLHFDAVRDRTLLVYASKTKRERTIDLLGPLRSDLAAYRLRRPGHNPLIFPGPQPDGSWSKSDVGNWRRRVWAPALKDVGLPASMVPYDLRHTFASLLLHEGRLSLAEIAEQLGHSVAVLASTYAHVIAELKGGERQSANDTIRAAREQVASEGWRQRKEAS